MMILKKIKLFLLPKTCFKNLLLIRYDLKINIHCVTEIMAGSVELNDIYFGE